MMVEEGNLTEEHTSFINSNLESLNTIEAHKQVETIMKSMPEHRYAHQQGHAHQGHKEPAES